MFENVILDRPGDQDNVYKVPSSQLLVIRSTEPVVPIQLNGLDTYFTNLQMPGREDCYIKIMHFDVPAYDSLRRTLTQWPAMNVGGKLRLWIMKRGE